MNKKMKLITFGGVALFLICLILGVCLTYKGKPDNAKELLSYASDLMDSTKYVTGNINCELVGVQEEQNIDVNIENEYTYDVRTNVCNAKLTYETQIGEAEVNEKIYIWNVGEKEKDKTVYYAYTQTEGDEYWYKEQIKKTNDEIYRLNVFSLILQNKSELKLKDKMKKINDEECYVVDATVSAKVADILTNEVDILTAISDDSDNNYLVTLYFNKNWEPVKIYMDFMGQVVADGEADGLAIVMDKAFYEHEYKEFKSFKKLKMSKEVKKVAVLMKSIGGDTDVEVEKEEYTYEYPLAIMDENTSTVVLQSVKNLVIDNELTNGDYAKFYLDNIDEYNYVEAYTYNYTWAESNEQALQLLLESIVNLEDYMKNEEGYTDVVRSETVISEVEGYETHTVNMSYKYDESLFHQTDAFIKIQDKEYLRVTIVVVTGYEEQNPVDTDAFIKKFIKAMDVVPQKEVTE